MKLFAAYCCTISQCVCHCHKLLPQIYADETGLRNYLLSVEWGFIWVGSWLTPEHKILTESSATLKHSSLLWPNVNQASKKIKSNCALILITLTSINWQLIIGWFYLRAGCMKSALIRQGSLIKQEEGSIQITSSLVLIKYLVPRNRIHNTSFSSYLKYKPIKLECFITPH